LFFGKKKGDDTQGPNELSVWMDPIELSQLTAILFTLAPERCLEWGSGGSTKAILERCAFVKQYVSVEHHREWYEKVRELVTDPRLTLKHVAPDEPPPAGATEEALVRWNAEAEHEPARMASYVAFPRTLGVTFDFVLVDGRARCFCLKEGFDLLRPGGVIVLHDAQRTDYHDAVNALGDAIFLEPWKQGQICLVRKG